MEITPSITESQALQITKEQFQELSKINTPNIRKSPELTILPVENDKGYSYYLVYNIELDFIDSTHVFSQAYFVDAHNGQIVYEYSNIRNGYINATLNYKYWPQHYYDQQSGDQLYKNAGVTLYNLLGQVVESQSTNSNGYVSFNNLAYNTYFLVARFDNSYVRLQNTSGLEKSLLPGSYNLSWNAADESNVFHHVNFIHNFFKSSPFNYDDMDYRMDAFINEGSSDNGWSDGINVGFGSQSGYYWARSSDVIYHEYTHNTIHHLYGRWIGSYPYYEREGYAMDEGFADYFAVSINDDPIQGESVGVNRNLDNTRTMDDYEYIYYRGIQYDNSLIISGACWDVRENEQIGTALANELIFDALVLHAYNFADFMDNLLIADDDNGDISDGTPHD